MKESEFARELIGRVNGSVTRIETGSTQVGVPDLFIQVYGSDYWVELKSVKQVFNSAEVRVPWRRGQQMWASEYRRRHLFTCGPLTVAKCTWTIMRFINGVFFIPMQRLFDSNKVPVSEGYFLPDNVWRHADLGTVLERYSYMVLGSKQPVAGDYKWLCRLAGHLWGEPSGMEMPGFDELDTNTYNTMLDGLYARYLKYRWDAGGRSLAV